MQNIRWAVLGTGVIANEMAVALKKNGRNIDAVGNRTHEKAVAFAEKYGIKKVYDNYNDMFTDPDIDVIYITTPHNTHINFMRRAIENGKHILVEKSITLNSRELDEAIALADKKGVVIGEAMTIYHMPIYKKLKEILESGKLGKVNLITMNFGSFKEYDMNNRFFNKNLAGGAMLDIGVYALSFIRWFMDSKPDQLLSQVKPAPTGVDEQAGLLLMNQEGQMASVMLSLHSKQPKRGMVSCEKGYIEIMEYPRAWEARITYTDSGETEMIQTGEHADALAYELADMEKAIRGDAECMHLDYTKDVMDMMTDSEKNGDFSIRRRCKLWYENTSFFSGDVQGVGFRYRSFYIAQSLGLAGWVENLWDGRVEMEVQGSEVSIREMLARIQQQRWINVADMEITEIPCEEERGFKIR